MKLDRSQEDVLSDLINLEDDTDSNMFGYLDEHIIDEKNKLEAIDFLEKGGYISVDRLAGNPVNVVVTEHGREYFREEIKPKENSSNGGNSIVFLIIGIIIGAVIMYLMTKYNIIA